jgi:hypothetical protein
LKIVPNLTATARQSDFRTSLCSISSSSLGVRTYLKSSSNLRVMSTYWYKSIERKTMMDMYKLNQVPSETKIKMYLRRILYGGKNMECPECKSRLICQSEDRYSCRRCRWPVIPSHTWLASIRLPYSNYGCCYGVGADNVSVRGKQQS